MDEIAAVIAFLDSCIASKEVLQRIDGYIAQTSLNDNLSVSTMLVLREIAQEARVALAAELARQADA